MKQSTIRAVFFLTLGWFGIQMAMALDATQFQVMLDAQVHNAMMIGAVLALGPIAGIVIQPIVGWYGDIWEKRGFSRSRLMTWSLLGALLSTLALSIPMGIVPMTLLIAVFFISFNVLMVTYRAFVTQTSGRRALLDHKGLISGFVALFSGAGSFAMFALCSALGGTGYPFWIAGGLLLLIFVLFFRWSPRPKGGVSVEETVPSAQQGLFARWNLLFYLVPVLGLASAIERRVCQQPGQRAIFRLFTVLFFSWLGIQALRGYFVLFASKALHVSLSMANLLLAILTLVMVAAAIPLGRAADRFDNRTLYRYCLVFFAGVCLLSYLMVDSLPMAVVMSVLLGVSFAGMIVCPLSLLFKLCPAQSEGIYAGLYNLFLSVPQLYSLLITGWLIEQTQDYRVILLMAGVSVALAFWVSFRMPLLPISKDSPEAVLA